MLLRALIRLVAVMVFLLVVPLTASAHATLVETEPANGSQLDQAPSEVVVSFTEAVEAPVAAVRVFDSAGTRVDAGDAGPGPSPERVRVGMPTGLEADTYVVTWGVISLDGHPIQGAFTFQVGAGAVSADDSLVASLLGERGGGMYAAGGAVARWVSYLAGLVVTGAAMFFWLVARREALQPSIGRLVRTAAWIGMAASLLQIPLFGGEVSGVLRAAALGEALTSPIGVAAVVRAGGLAVIAWGVTRVPASVWLWPGIAGLVISELLAGHTITTEPAWMVIAADAIHVLGSAVWIGGLAALFVVLRERHEAEAAAGWIAHFSTMAVASVLALGVAGLALAWAQVRTFGALTSTAYGWTLLVKVGLGAAVMTAGAYNNRFLVPTIRRASEESATAGVSSSVATLTRPDQAAFSKLRRIVGLELVGLAAVLAVTALLVNLEPAAEAAGVSGPFSTYVAFGEGQLNLVVDPNEAGINQIHAYVLTAAGAPASVEGDAVMELSLPSQDIGPFLVEPLSAGPGHWIHTGPELAIPGDWQITFRLGSGFEESVATTTVGVTP